MGTSEEVRSEHQRQYGGPNHAARVLHVHHSVHSQPPPSAGAAYSSPGSQPNPSAWPPQKHLDGELTHNQAMDVDPSYEEPSSPSPTHYGSNGSAFPFTDSASNQHQHQQSFGGLVATPITRFLTKQTFGFIPKPPTFPSAAERSTPSSPALPSSPLLNGDRKVPALRLPSLGTNNGSLPQSPLQSPHQPSFSLPAGETLSRLFGSASIDNNSSNPPTPTRGSTVTLPPLKRACPSPTTTPTLPPLAQHLSLDDICKPFRYQRSLSCPSDTMARAAAEEAAYEAYSAPRAMLQFTDVPKNRLERSNSMDVSAVIAMREAHQRALYGEPERSSSSGYDHHSGRYDHHSNVATSSSSNNNNGNVDYHGWLEHRNRHPLASLAESAHAMQRLEQSRSPSASESESSQAPNPFAINADDFKREKKLCAFPQCSSNAVTRGLCISHGGGRRCQRKGCTRGAQSKGLCVAHGGGRICRAKGCSNIQRSMGLCIRHGGGKRCSVAGCQKGVVRQDLCTAHGGKRKCRVEDCNKHVKKKGLCRSHANSVLGAGAMSPVHDEMDEENSE